MLRFYKLLESVACLLIKYVFFNVESTAEGGGNQARARAHSLQDR